MTVGWNLRCNFYCLDHKPACLTRSEKLDLVELTDASPREEWADDSCEECDRTLGEVADAPR